MFLSNVYLLLGLKGGQWCLWDGMWTGRDFRRGKLYDVIYYDSRSILWESALDYLTDEVLELLTGSTE